MRLLSIFLLIYVVQGCSTIPSQNQRIQSADNIAKNGKLQKKRYQINGFNILAYQNIAESNTIATIYFEGDGLAFLPRGRISPDPTPINPVALRLAVKDSAENIIYLSRPCQYVWSDKCQIDYWISARYSPEVVNIYEQLLNNIKAKYKVTEFNFVGFSGGAAIAILVASRRNDVKQIITVAGNLDHKAVSKEHGVPYLEQSLNPSDVADQVSAIPQLHLVGGQDLVISSDIAKGYVTNMLNQNCSKVSVISSASHEYGWSDGWNEILSIKLTCLK